MIINVRIKGMKIAKDFTGYIREKLEKSEKYFRNINEIDVFLSKQKYLYGVEIVLNIIGQTIKIKQEAADIRSAIDIAVDKIEQQVRREGKKIKDRRKSLGVELLSDKYQQEGKVFTNIDKRKFVPVVSSVNDAIKFIDDNGYMFWVFINKDSNKLSVIYEKSESNYGLLEIEKR